MTDSGAYPAELRNWRRRLGQSMGMNPLELLSITDEDEHNGTVTVSWRATSEQAPTLPLAERSLTRNDEADPSVHAGMQRLLPHEWQGIIAAIGSKPQEANTGRHLD